MCVHYNWWMGGVTASDLHVSHVSLVCSPLPFSGRLRWKGGGGINGQWGIQKQNSPPPPQKKRHVRVWQLCFCLPKVVIKLCKLSPLICDFCFACQILIIVPSHIHGPNNKINPWTYTKLLFLINWCQFLHILSCKISLSFWVPVISVCNIFNTWSKNDYWLK